MLNRFSIHSNVNLEKAKFLLAQRLLVALSVCRTLARLRRLVGGSEREFFHAGRAGRMALSALERGDYRVVRVMVGVAVDACPALFRSADRLARFLSDPLAGGFDAEQVAYPSERGSL